MLITLAKISEREGSIYPSSFYGQLLVSHVSLTYLVDEFYEQNENAGWI